MGEAATAGVQMWGEKDGDDGGTMKGPVWGGFKEKKKMAGLCDKCDREVMMEFKGNLRAPLLGNLEG